MDPKHDQIVKPIDDGYSLVWDTNQVDRGLLEKVAEVSSRQAGILGEIIEGSEVEAAPEKQSKRAPTRVRRAGAKR